MTPWPKLSPPIFPMDNHKLQFAYSAQVHDGVADFREFARQYAAEQSPPEPIDRYENRRGI